MSYISDDISVDKGAPVECYKFIGELKTYYYTSDNQVVTCDGNDYIPLSGISRSALEISSLLDSVSTIDVIVPVTCAMAQAYSFLKMPMTLDVEIREFHRDNPTDFKVTWRGQSVSFPFQENYSTIRTQSIIQASLSQQLNQIYFQTPCNHLVYDEHCTLDPAAFTTAATVTDIKGSVITVDSTGNADHALIVGKCINTRTSESRLIVENIGDILTLGYAFIDVRDGDTLHLVRGCDNSYTTCRTVFNNLINFSGFKWMPSTNPYTDPV